MANPIYKSRNKGITNSWTAIRNQAIMSGIYEADVYTQLAQDNDPSKAQGYLAMLAANGKALKDKLPAEYSNYSTTTKYSLLSGLSSIIAYENDKNNIDYAVKNEEYGKKSDKSWVDKLVNEKFAGDYEAFNKQYSGEEGKNKLYEEGYFVDTDLTDEQISYGLTNFSKSYSEFSQEYEAKPYMSYSELLKNIAIMDEQVKTYEAWENTSSMTKFWSTIGSFAAEILLTPLEMVEGLTDAILTIGSFAANSFGYADVANDILDYAKEDFIPTQDWVVKWLPNAYSTNPYSTQNWAKLGLGMSQSISRILVMSGLNYLLPGSGTLLYYGSAAGENAVEYATANPEKSINNVMVYSAMKTAISYAVEGMSETAFFKQQGWIKAWENFGSKNVTTKMLHDFIGEGFEEVVEEIIDAGLDYAFTGNTDISFKSLWESFISGALVGGIMAGGHAAVQKVITTKTAVSLTSTKIDKKTGKPINSGGIQLSPAKTALLLNYKDTLEQKVKSGKKLSTRMQQRYDRLQNLALLAVDDAGNTIATISNFGDPTKNDTITVDKNSKDPKVKKLSINEDLLKKKLEEFQTEGIEIDLASLDLTDADIASEAQNMQQNLFLTLSEFAAYMGPDQFARSLGKFEQYTEDTIDKLLDMSEAVTERETKQVKTYAKTESVLSEAFGSKIYITKIAKDVAISFEKIDRLTKAKYYSYYSTGENLPVVFSYNGDVYLNAAVTKNFSLPKIQQLIFSTIYNDQLFAKIGSNDTIMNLLENLVKSYNIDLSNEVKHDIMLKQALFTMLFVQDNTIASKAYMSAKDEYGKLMYNLILSVKGISNVNSMQVVRQAEKNYYRTALNKVFESEQSEAIKSLQLVIEGAPTFFKSDEDIENFIINNRDPNAFNYMTFKADINTDAADLAMAIEYFSKQFGFNIPKNANILTINNLALALFDSKNYNDTRALDQALSAYDTNFFEQMNYFLADNFGFEVLPDNTIVHLRQISQMINEDILSERINTYAADSSAHLNIDKGILLSECLTDYGKKIIGPSLLGNDIVIYLRPDNVKGTNGSFQRFLRPNNGIAGVIMIAAKANPDVSLEQNQKNMLQTAEHEINHSICGLTNTGTMSFTDPIKNYFEQQLKSLKGEELENYLEKLQDEVYDFLFAVEGKGLVQYTEKGVLWTDADTENNMSVALSNLGFTGDEQYKPILAEQLARMVYQYCFMNERYAQGMASASYADTVVDFNSFRYENADQIIIRTHSKLKLLKRLDGIIARRADLSAPKNVLDVLNQFSNKKITSDNAIKQLTTNYEFYSGEAQLGDLEALFPVKPTNDSDYVSKDFWISQINDMQLKQTISAMPQQDFIRFIAKLTGKEFNVLAKIYQDVTEVNRFMNIPFAPDKSYAASLANGIKPRNLIDSAQVYTKYGDKISGIALYDSTSKSCTVDLTNTAVNTSTANLINDLIANTTSGNRLFIAGNRSFINFNAIRKYLNVKPQLANLDISTSTLANFETAFSELSKMGIVGKQQAYQYDTIFVTNDGQIINVNSEGSIVARLQQICKNLKISEDILGEYTVAPDSGDIILNKEGLTNQLSKLFDSKRVARFRRTNNTWVSDSTLNILQDNFAKTLDANVNPAAQGYIELKRNVALVQDPQTLEVKIVPMTDGKFEGTEVAWAKNVWYESICNILTKYQITNFKQLENLGFSEEFIDKLSKYSGTKTDNPGITKSFILSYINDDTNTTFSRNLLIRNCPDSAKDSLDWKRNGYLTSVKDVQDYYNTFQVYFVAMEYARFLLESGKGNAAKLKAMLSTVYDSEIELHNAFDGFISAHRSDPDYARILSDITEGKYIREEDNVKRKVKSGLDDRRTNIITDLLNIDAQKRLNYANGLNLSYNSFGYVYGLISKDWGMNYNVISTDVGANYKDSDDVLNLLDTLDVTKSNVQSADVSEEIAKINDAIKFAAEQATNDAKLKAYEKVLTLLDTVSNTDIYGDINTDAYANLVLDQMDKLSGINLDISKAASDYIQNIKTNLESVKDKTGIEKERINAEIETEFHKFSNERVRNTYKYGYEGYRQIRKLYDSYGASQRFNTSSKISKRVKNFKDIVQTALKSNQITQERADKLNRSIDTLRDIYTDILSVAVDFEYNGMTRSKATSEIIKLIDNFTSGKPVTQQLQTITDFIDTAIISSEITYDEKAKTAYSDLYKFNAEQRKFLYLLRTATNEQKLNIFLQYLDDPNVETELGRALVTYMENQVKELSSTTNTVSFVEEAIDFSKLGQIAKKAGVAADEEFKRLNPDKKINRRITNEERTALQASRVTTRTLSTQKRHLDLLANSKPVSDVDMQNAVKEVYATLEKFKFKTQSDQLRKEARKWYKINYPNETITIAKGISDEITSTDIESARQHREQAIANYIDNRAKEYGQRYVTRELTLFELIKEMNKEKYIKKWDKANNRWKLIKVIAPNPMVFKVINGLNIAYQRFIYGPKTKANIEQFHAEVQYVLSERKINSVIPGTKELVSLDSNYIDYEAVLEMFKRGEYTDHSNVFDETFGKVTSEMEAAQDTIDYVTNKKVYTNPIESINNALKETEAKIALLNEELRTKQFTSQQEAGKRRALENAQNKLKRIQALKEGTAEILNRQIENGPNTETVDTDAIIDLFVDDTVETTEPAEATNTENIPDDLFVDEVMTDNDSEIMPPSMAEQSINLEELFGEGSAKEMQNLFNITSKKNAEKVPRTDEQKYAPKNPERSKFTPTINSKLLNRQGIDVRKLLDYIPSKTKDVEVAGETITENVFSTNEYLKENGELLREFMHNEDAVKDFLKWYSSTNNMTEAERTNAAVLLNQIASNLNISKELRIEAAKAFSKIKRTAGQQLSVARSFGLAPLDELNAIAEQQLSLSDDEIKSLANLADIQKKAIETGDYAASDKAMDDALAILAKHSNELDSSINPWKKGLTLDEKAVRWHNLTQRITSWRYFAMLSAPATFFSRNVAGNALITVMDKASVGIGNLIGKIRDRFSKTKNNGVYYKRTNEKVNAEATAAVKKHLLDNGLLDSILKGTVSKYDTGYTPRKTKLSELAFNNKNAVEDIDAADAIVLGDTLKEGTPFGTSKVGGVFNKMYNFIFGVMDSQDKKSMKKYMKRTVEQIVSDNFTADDYTKLEAGDLSTKQKFQDIIAFAQEESLKTYFRYQGPAYTTMMRLLAKYPAAQAVFATIFPFPRMLLNTMNTALNYSPIGFVKAVWAAKHDQTVFKDLKVNKQLGQAAIGTVSMAIGALLTALGMIKFEDDDKYGGPQINLFDTFRISLEDLAPAAIPFCIGASFTDGLTSGFWNAITNSGSALLDTTIIGELINVFGGNKNALDVVSNTFSTYINQFMPAIVRHVTRITDPNKKKYSSNSALKILQKIAAQIPGLSYIVPNQVDPYSGDNVTYYADNNNPYLAALMSALNAVLPAKVAYSKDNYLEQESRAVGAGTTGPASSFTIDGVQYKISDKKYREYQKLRAKLYKQYADKVIVTDAYKRMTNEQKKKQLKKLQSKATEEARKQLNIK